MKMRSKCSYLKKEYFPWTSTSFSMQWTYFDPRLYIFNNNYTQRKGVFRPIKTLKTLYNDFIMMAVGKLTFLSCYDHIWPTVLLPRFKEIFVLNVTKFNKFFTLKNKETVTLKC